MSEAPRRRWIGWAVDIPGRLLHVEYCESRDVVWRHALGWPSAEEIEDAKRKGARAFQVQITEIEGTSA